jgi:hypothetical protein
MTFVKDIAARCHGTEAEACLRWRKWVPVALRAVQDSPYGCCFRQTHHDERTTLILWTKVMMAQQLNHIVKP